MLKKLLLPAAEDAAVAEKSIEEMRERLISIYERGVEYGMSTVESEISQCFKIPENVLLPADKDMVLVSIHFTNHLLFYGKCPWSSFSSISQGVVMGPDSSKGQLLSKS